MSTALTKINQEFIRVYRTNDEGGLSSDKGDTDNEPHENAEELIAEDLEESIRHDAIPVPPRSCLFSPSTSAVFFVALQKVQERQVVLDGYGLKPEEWEDAFYPLSETITFGVGGKKKLKVILPVEIWWPRALAWVQGLDLMERILIDSDNESNLST
ncbi:uncharacterized protein STEHIDRAFT_161518 [Stereum hirsutum FP-91666 SS1]|uniref:uncharacterized protein n=1 Tax=Stereum hirsutum (strain FP-91666) TaxID=721885 RepID=UPI0004449C92|nr:uncharacterized protein STEHIDRAFT_161518 [Stereum hirsutum FP-91666 SS1]EIM82173.1 hypothetical protein STEHIDRAFT_161518 [Stereum hirsutum FP-91666 SS1]